ncbi:hypothetical protein [uncultured Tateyamaria sp.]|uniref:hypothetical protein n=1 Tax=uncultured Tateyamaria sp. TaxID=455651 RepID=UPI002607EF6E|nr:hypothetical protein [uncultured Tateyamaria sp.]
MKRTKRTFAAIGAAVLAWPTVAHAYACTTLRPDWDGTPASAVGETIGLLTAPMGLFLLAATVMAVLVRSQWGGLVAVLLWTAFITFVTMADSDGQRTLAMAEGCVGPPTLFIATAAAICVAIVLYTMPRKSGD